MYSNAASIELPAHDPVFILRTRQRRRHPLTPHIISNLASFP